MGTHNLFLGKMRTIHHFYRLKLSFSQALNNKILHTHAINVTCIIYDFIFQEGFITSGYHVTAS